MNLNLFRSSSNINIIERIAIKVAVKVGLAIVFISNKLKYFKK
jgi:hypothetical protein